MPTALTQRVQDALDAARQTTAQTRELVSASARMREARRVQREASHQPVPLAARGTMAPRPWPRGTLIALLPAIAPCASPF